MIIYLVFTLIQLLLKFIESILRYQVFVIKNKTTISQINRSVLKFILILMLMCEI